MSPVHVIVGEDPRAEQMWAQSFTGAVDLYRFGRNVEAFERLMVAQAPVDLVVLTPAQSGPFNLTPDQFVARVLEGPLASSGVLANLHVIVVGAPLERTHPRAMAVSTLDAAIRLVKFGEVERAPRPAPVAAAPIVPTTVARGDSAGGGRRDLGDLGEFSGSVISRIWREADEADRDEDSHGDAMGDVLGGGPAARAAAAPMQVMQSTVPEAAAMPQDATAPASLFSRTAPAGFVAGGGGAAPASAPVQPSPVSDHGAAPMLPTISGGGGAPAMQVGAPGESIEVATGVLQPARGYQLDGGGAYRGPGLRNGHVHGAGHDVAGGQPVPPALASQVQSMVYGSMQVGNPHDPMLVWSSSARAANAAAPGAQPAAAVGAPVPTAPAATAGVPVPASVLVQPAQAGAVRTVPMEPPPGVYQGVAPAQPAPPSAAAADPFLARAEARGGDVAFG
jgi:hypothetical protein